MDLHRRTSSGRTPDATLRDKITSYVKRDADQVKWDTYLGPLQLAYNSSTHSATDYTPFYFVHGREARSPAQAGLDATNVAVGKYAKTLEVSINHAQRLVTAYNLKSTVVNALKANGFRTLPGSKSVIKCGCIHVSIHPLYKINKR